MAKKKLNVGVIGYGFMGRTHSNAYRMVGNFFDVPYEPVLKVICGLGKDEAKAFAQRWGFESHTTNWRQVIEDEDINVVDICVPNNVHAEIAIAAAKAGKAICCEKPLALNAAQAEQMVKAIEDAKVPNMVSFNYRRVPAVTLAKMLIDQGRLGQIFHYRANFLQDWTISTKVPQGGMGTWRLDVKAAGSGVTGDLLAHCIDTALWHNGLIGEVCAMTETFIKQRMHAETGKVEPVGIDDACTFFCRFDNGSLGNFESTRYARGHKALYTFEINGEHASIAWDLHDLHRLSYFDHRDESIVRGWRSVHVTDGDMPYMGKWWVPGLQIGYAESFVHQTAEFLANLAEGKPTAPTFRDALATQYVCDAVLASAKDKTWVKVKKA
jgi:predicted dehydrogenase